ncbi:MAG TPA: MlaD family protein [Solirubrobacteraceae bacterium]|nr:MlaD family protein [Solirubrobacteraceae bacterium]
MSLILGHRRLVGVLAALIGVAVVAVAALRPNPFARTITVRALFSDASGLARIGADVLMAGTPVGHVLSVRRVGGAALVSMRIDRSAGSVHHDASADLRPRLLFEGTAYVDLYPGSAGSGPLDGQAIPLSRTHSYVSLQDAVDVLGPATRAEVDELASAGSRVLGPGAVASVHHAVSLAPSITVRLAQVAGAVQGNPTRGALAHAVSALERTAAAVSARAAALEPIVREGAASAAALSGPALDRTLAALPSLGVELRAGGGQAAAVLSRMGPLADALVPAARSLPATLARVRPLLRQGTVVLSSAQPLVSSAQRLLNGAGDGSLPALRALDAVSPTVAEFTSGGLLRALQAPTDIGIPSYLAFLGMFEGGGGASAPFTTASSTLGAGHFMRFGFRFLTGLGIPTPPCTLVSLVSPTLASSLATTGVCQS